MSWQTYKRLMTYALPYWRQALLSLVAMVGIAVLEPVLPALLKPLIDEGMIGKNEKSIWQLPILIFLAFFAKGVAEYLASISSQTLANRAVTDLRNHIYKHQLRLNLLEHAIQGPGVMTSRILYDTTQVGAALSTSWLTLIRDTLIIVGLTSYLIYVSAPLAFLVLGMTPVVAISINLAAKKLRASNLKLQKHMAQFTENITETLAGIIEIKAFNAEESQATEFKRVSEKVCSETIHAGRIQSLNVPLVQLIAAFAVAVVILVAGRLNSQNMLTAGEFVSFVAAMSMVFEPVRRLTNVNAVIQRGLAAAHTIFSMLDIKEEDADEIASKNNCVRASGIVRFENVSFGYGNGRPVVRELTFSIKPNQMIALVGPSGSGKSTIAALLAGLYAPTTGEIFLDSKSVTEWGVSCYRRQIALVSQQVVLFGGTIEQNIRMGKPDATAEEVKNAAIMANAIDFIDSLPKKFQTNLSVFGSSLSGGQRQRIAVARAFLRDAPVLILDEATSSLDKDTETELVLAIEKLRENRSVLVIAHRLHTIESADKVVVIQDGKIIAEGTADKLRIDGHLT